MSGASPVVSPHSDPLPPASSQQSNGTSKGALAALLIAGVVIFVGGIAASRMSERDVLKKPVEPSTNATLTAPLAPTVSASAPKIEPVVLHVRLSSEPEGAVVREDGVEVCNATPCELSYSDDAAKREHKVVVQKAGFKAETKIFMADAKTVQVKLVRDTRVFAQPPQTGKDPGVPPGYKPEVPY